MTVFEESVDHDQLFYPYVFYVVPTESVEIGVCRRL